MVNYYFLLDLQSPVSQQSPACNNMIILRLANFITTQLTIGKQLFKLKFYFICQQQTFDTLLSPVTNNRNVNNRNVNHWKIEGALEKKL